MLLHKPVIVSMVTRSHCQCLPAMQLHLIMQLAAHMQFILIPKMRTFMAALIPQQTTFKMWTCVELVTSLEEIISVPPSDPRDCGDCDRCDCILFMSECLASGHIAPKDVLQWYICRSGFQNQHLNYCVDWTYDDAFLYASIYACMNKWLQRWVTTK